MHEITVLYDSSITCFQRMNMSVFVHDAIGDAG